MRADEVQRWIQARRFMDRFQQESHGIETDRGAAWQQALALFALLGRMIGWPVPPDDVRRREEAAGAAAWSRLRGAYARRS